jgi:hypothetical protein
MKIKIRVKSGKWIDAPAFPTSHPALFVTPERYRELKDWTDARGKLRFKHGRARFLKDQWTITHRPSGYSIIFGTFELEEARKLAELFAKSSIPWKKLRSKRDAKQYARQHRAIMRKFFRDGGSVDEPGDVYLTGGTIRTVA